MKTILKYISSGRYVEKPVKIIAGDMHIRLNKIMTAVVLILSTTQNAFGQHNVSNLQPDGMLIMNIGVDDVFCGF